MLMGINIDNLQIRFAEHPTYFVMLREGGA
jgi:hypothetical protein